MRAADEHGNLWATIADAEVLADVAKTCDDPLLRTIARAELRRLGDP